MKAKELMSKLQELGAEEEYIFLGEIIGQDNLAKGITRTDLGIMITNFSIKEDAE